jgi:hypothetical protein
LLFEDGCYQAVDGATRSPLIWPRGTTTADDGSIRLTTGETLELGERFNAAGGYHAREEFEELPTSCAIGEDEVAVVGAVSSPSERSALQEPWEIAESRWRQGGRAGSVGATARPDAEHHHHGPSPVTVRRGEHSRVRGAT